MLEKILSVIVFELEVTLIGWIMYGNGLHVDVVYCDFMKAFEKVSHTVSGYHISWNITISLSINWVKDFLSDRKQ